MTQMCGATSSDKVHVGGAALAHPARDPAYSVHFALKEDLTALLRTISLTSARVAEAQKDAIVLLKRR